MGFYDLSKEERKVLVDQINHEIHQDLKQKDQKYIVKHFSDEDTYIRKTSYLAIGRIFYAEPQLQDTVLSVLKTLFKSDSEKIRQTVMNAAGEIGKFHFDRVQEFFDLGLFDKHHSVRNAVIGSVKKMGEKNPEAVLPWAKTYIIHEDPEVRREICHGIELRGRTHPEDVLPLLKSLEFDKKRRVSDTLIHVLGQIAYKNGCLQKVITHLNTWKNLELVEKALDEIVDVHDRYKKFAVLTQQQVIEYIDQHYKPD